MYKHIVLMHNDQCSCKFIIQCALYEITGHTYWKINIDKYSNGFGPTKLHVVAYYNSGSSYVGINLVNKSYDVIVFDIIDHSDYSKDFLDRLINVIENEAIKGNVKSLTSNKKHEILEIELRKQLEGK